MAGVRFDSRRLRRDPDAVGCRACSFFFFEISLVCGFATSHAACEHSPDTVAGSRAVVTGADTGNADARSQRQAQ